MLPLKILKFRVSEIASSDFRDHQFQQTYWSIHQHRGLLSVYGFPDTSIFRLTWFWRHMCREGFTPRMWRFLYSCLCLPQNFTELFNLPNKPYFYLLLYLYSPFFARACNSNNLVLFPPVVLGCHATGLVFHAFKLTLFSSNSAFALSDWTRVSSNLAPPKLRCSHVAASIWGNCTS